MKYKLEITFNDYTTEEYYSNHLNINGLMSSEHVRDINIINITHYENKSKRVNWEYSILINTNTTNICFTYNNKLMKIIDGMIYLSEIDKWVFVEEYKEYVQWRKKKTE